MNNTITIYKITCTKARMMSETGTGYGLRPWGKNTVDYEGYDDGGNIYELPDGYEVSESNGGTTELYDPQGRRVEIVDDHGHPALYVGDGINKNGDRFTRYLRLDK